MDASESAGQQIRVSEGERTGLWEIAVGDGLRVTLAAASREAAIAAATEAFGQLVDCHRHRIEMVFTDEDRFTITRIDGDPAAMAGVRSWFRA